MDKTLHFVLLIDRVNKMRRTLREIIQSRVFEQWQIIQFKNDSNLKFKAPHLTQVENEPK